MRRYALTAIGRDRPGIVADVTKALYDHDCNLEDSSMTRLEDEFAIILIMSAPEGMDENAISEDLVKTERKTGLTIHLKELDEKAPAGGELSNFIITLHGADKTGIVYRTAEALRKWKVNIVDLETSIVGSGREKVYIMVMEVRTPDEADSKEIKKELKELATELGVTIKMKPLEDFEPL